MKHVSIKQAADQLAALAREAEAGMRITITRNGKAVAELGPVARPMGGLDLSSIRRWKAERGVDRIVTYIADDFDAPLPEDFLITPGPA